MLLTFSHIVDGQRVPLLDGDGREVKLSVDATSKMEAINAQETKDFIAGKGQDVRVRRVL